MNDSEIIEKLLTFLREKKVEINNRGETLYDWERGVNYGRRDTVEELERFISKLKSNPPC